MVTTSFLFLILSPNRIGGNTSYSCLESCYVFERAINLMEQRPMIYVRFISSASTENSGF